MRKSLGISKETDSDDSDNTGDDPPMNPLSRYIRENKQYLTFSRKVDHNGNCWYDSVVDQVAILKITNVLNGSTLFLEENVANFSSLSINIKKLDVGQIRKEQVRLPVRLHSVG